MITVTSIEAIQIKRYSALSPYSVSWFEFDVEDIKTIGKLDRFLNFHYVTNFGGNHGGYFEHGGIVNAIRTREKT